MHPVGSLVEKAYDLHCHSLPILSDLAQKQLDSSAIIESLLDTVLRLYSKILTLSRISVDVSTAYPGIDSAEVSVGETVSPPHPDYPEYPVPAGEMFPSVMPVLLIRPPPEYAQAGEYLHGIEKIFQGTETPLQAISTYSSDYRRDITESQTKEGFRSWWELSTLMRNEIVRSMLRDTHHIRATESVQNLQSQEKILNQGPQMPSFQSTIRALAYTQQLKIHPGRIPFSPAALVERILQPVQSAISVLKGPSEKDVSPPALNLPGLPAVEIPLTGGIKDYSPVPILPQIAHITQNNPSIQAFNTYMHHYRKSGEILPSMILQTGEYNDGDRHPEFHNFYSPHSVSSIISNPMEIFLNLSETVSKEFSYNQAASPRGKDVPISVKNGDEKRGGTRESVKDFKTPQITLDLPPFLPIKRNAPLTHQFQKEGTPRTPKPGRDVIPGPSGTASTSKTTVLKEASSVLNHAHDASRVEQFTNTIVSSITGMHQARTSLMHSYNSIVGEGVPSHMTGFIGSDMLNTGFHVSNMLSEYSSSYSTVTHLLESAVHGTTTSIPHERETAAIAPRFISIGRDIRPPAPAAIVSHPAIGVSGLGLPSPNITTQQQSTEKHSANHFQNTFNISVQMKGHSEEEELRELGKKIGAILSEEMKRYGGVP